MSDATATVVVGIAMAIGLAGTVVPLLPGLLLIWAAAIVYGLLTGFGTIGIGVTAALTALVLVGAVKSVLVPRRMAEGRGVSGWSQFVAFGGALLGFVFIPVVGAVVGALGGLFVAELVNHRNVPVAGRATLAVAKGFGLSAIIDVGLGMAMIALWMAWALTVVT